MFRRSIRRWTNRIRIARFGVREFVNFPTYFWLLRKAGGGHATLRTRDGLSLRLRKNRSDARIVTEMYMIKPYLRHGDLGENPKIVDVGAYIGDFSLYIAHRHNAHVIAVEPTVENRAVLEENIQINDLADRIKVLPVAIGKSGSIPINVEAHGNEIHASSYWYAGAESRELPSWSLDELLEWSDLQHVDLLKLDCEGCEYDAVQFATDSALARFEAVVIEYHKVPEWETRLANLRTRLVKSGLREVSDHDHILHFERK